MIGFRRLLALFAALFLATTAAQATVQVTDLGSVSGSSGSTLSLTVSGGVPAGALIVVVFYEYSNPSTNATITDSAGNTYTNPNTAGYCISPNNSEGSYGYSCIAFVGDASAIASNGTITLTRGTNNSGTVMEAFYATGIYPESDPLDEGSTGYYGNTSTPRATASVVSHLGDLFVGWVAAASGSAVSWTQDSTNANWQNPPDQVYYSGTNINLFGGNFVAVGTAPSAQVYAPTMGAATPWGSRIFAFRAAPNAAFLLTPAVVP